MQAKEGYLNQTSRSSVHSDTLKSATSQVASVEFYRGKEKSFQEKRRKKNTFFATKRGIIIPSGNRGSSVRFFDRG